MAAEKPDFLEVENAVQSDRSSGDALEPAWTEEEERAVRRKMDWHLVPLVTLLYLLCFLDRSNIGNARIQGLAKDLQLVGYQFNWSLTVFYVTYMLRIPQWGVAATPIHTWRNIFFFEGLITLLVGGASPWLMATKPEECGFLTERQRYIAAERLYLDHKSSAVNEKVTLQDVKRAVFNVNNNVCAFGFFLINITVQSISLFMPTLLADLGWTATKAQLHTVPPYVLACLVAIAVAFASDRTRRRGVWLALFAPVGIVGFAVLRADGVSPNIKYMAVFFVTIGVFPGGPAFLSWGLNSMFFFPFAPHFVASTKPRKKKY
ncbi:hypothetical protein SLS55_004834 [Diplodia seriata]|uniref:Uncharacterized protein n=1 Tax=Diplodia seriata TaxID=420778 RepID=A0ABR3CKH3_9PEZI